MGNSSRGNGAGKTYSDKPLTQRPFKKDSMKEFKPWGPACLKCGEPIDTRLGASQSNSMRGAKRSQRQGYVHDRCLENVEGQPAVVHSNLLSSLNEGTIIFWSEGKKVFLDTVQGRGTVMEFPVYTEDEMFEAIEAGEALPA